MKHRTTPHTAPALRWLLLTLAWLLALSRPTLAAPPTGPHAAAARPLAGALNPNGTLRTGLHGSFDPTGYVLGTDAASGQPVFRLARPAGAAKVAKVAGALGAGDDKWQNGFGLPGTNGDVYAMAVAANGDVYIGGRFTAVGTTPARFVARWNISTSTWSPLGAGLSNTVLALAVAANGDVYAGGFYIQAGVAARNVARWNATANTWSPLGTGLNGRVRALAVAGADVYAGGDFTQAGGAPASSVAKWNSTTNTWSPLGAGVSGSLGTVNALAVAGADVYVGGDFTQAGTTATSGIARWNATTSTWSPLGAGVDGFSPFTSVNALAVAGADVYVGGYFTYAGTTAASRVARWNAATGPWSPLGAGLNNVVNALAVAGADVYVGGDFNVAGGAAASNVARWNATTST